MLSSPAQQDLEIDDDERIFLTICNFPVRHCVNIEGQKVIGPETTLLLKLKLREHGFEIIRARATKG